MAIRSALEQPERDCERASERSARSRWQFALPGTGRRCGVPLQCLGVGVGPTDRNGPDGAETKGRPLGKDGSQQFLKQLDTQLATLNRGLARGASERNGVAPRWPGSS